MMTALSLTPVTPAAAVARAVAATDTEVVAAVPVTWTKPAVEVLFTGPSTFWVILTAEPPTTEIVPIVAAAVGLELAVTVTIPVGGVVAPMLMPLLPVVSPDTVTVTDEPPLVVTEWVPRLVSVTVMAPVAPLTVTLPALVERVCAAPPVTVTYPPCR